MKLSSLFAAAVLIGATSLSSPADEWIQFRGPGGLGHGEGEGLPTSWSDSSNIVWKSRMPGGGTSSPIVLDGKIYLTCYSGYGLNEDSPGDMNDLMRHVVCINRSNGDIVWQREFAPELDESKYQGNGARHGYSSSTVTTDGEHLYVFFGKSGVYCLSPKNGDTVWQTRVGDKVKGWGSSNSPVLFGDLLIINASIESQQLLALNKADGEVVWSVGEIRGSWNTPVLVENDSGTQELVLCIPEKILAFDPKTGKPLWTATGIPDRGYVCPSVVAHKGVVYAIGGRKNTAIAVRAGGSGDVTESHTLWTTSKGSNVSSPVFHDGHIFWVHESRGVAYCLNAENGEIVYEERLSPRPGLIYSSTMVADGKLYCVSQHNGTYVLAASPEFKLLAHNTFESDESRSNAIPVVSQNQLLLRSDEFLYCIGME